MDGFPPPGNGQWSARVLRELAALPCSEAVRFKLEHLIGTLHFHFDSAATVQKQIRRYWQNDAERRQSISLFTSIPGISWIVAAHLVARLGDWRQIKQCAPDCRFPRAGVERTLHRS